MDNWGLTQWGYVISAVMGLYYICLSLKWIKDSNNKVNPFFWYILFLVAGYVFAVIIAAIARHYLLAGLVDVRDKIIFSNWWIAQNIVPAIVLFIMNVHATIRYFIRKK